MPLCADRPLLRPRRLPVFHSWMNEPSAASLAPALAQLAALALDPQHHECRRTKRHQSADAEPGPAVVGGRPRLPARRPAGPEHRADGGGPDPRRRRGVRWNGSTGLFNASAAPGRPLRDGRIPALPRPDRRRRADRLVPRDRPGRADHASRRIERRASRRAGRAAASTSRSPRRSPLSASGGCRSDARRSSWWCHRGHALAEPGAVDVSIRDEPFLVLDRRFDARQRADALCAAAGFVPRMVLEADDLTTVRGYVAAGLGVAILPADAALSPRTVSVPLTAPGRAPGLRAGLGRRASSLGRSRR